MMVKKRKRRAYPEKREFLLNYIEMKYGSRKYPSVLKFAKDMGVSWSAVEKWIIFDREPRREMRIKIQEKTRGHIRTDFWTL